MNTLFPTLEPTPRTADKILADAITEYNPSHVFALFSGGHDSLCAASIASKHPRFTACVHLNTGIGIEQTRQFVRDTCKEQGWPLLEYRADKYVRRDGKPDPQVYRDFVLQHGFPGAPQHTRMYNRLKERPLRMLLRNHKQGKQKIILVTGVRRQESRIRMGRITATQVDGGRVWVAPLVDWSGLDVSRHVDACGYARNEVKDLLHISGECLCGAMADIKGGEREAIAACFPAVDAEIAALESEAAARGVWCKWGHKPPQTVLNETKGQKSFPLCASCEWRVSGGQIVVNGQDVT